MVPDILTNRVSSISKTPFSPETTPSSARRVVSMIQRLPSSVKFNSIFHDPETTLLSTYPPLSVGSRVMFPRFSFDVRINSMPSRRVAFPSFHRSIAKNASSLVENECSVSAFADDTVIRSRSPSKTACPVSTSTIETIQSPSGRWSTSEPLPSVRRESIHPVSMLMNRTF